MTSTAAGPPLTAGSDAPGAAEPLLAAVRAALGGSYDVERPLGGGGMGRVFLGRDRTLDRPVAIKVIAPELAGAPAVRERFLHEARAVARLRHPNVVAVYAAGEAAGMPYLVMELVPGETLHARLAREGRFDDRRAVEAVRDLARALAAAHAAGVVHRDVKPENVLLDRETGRAMLADFGVARARGSDGGGADDGRLTGRGFVLGSPRYMSPEQAAGEREVDGRSDVYSLGLVAYEMFAGEPAITATSAPSMLVKQLTETPAPIETRSARVAPAVAAVIARALEKEPERRFPGAAAMADALDAALRGDAAVPRRRWGVRAGVVAALAVAALVVAALAALALAAVVARAAPTGRAPRAASAFPACLPSPSCSSSRPRRRSWAPASRASSPTTARRAWPTCATSSASTSPAPTRRPGT